MAVRTAIAHPSGALPRTPFPASRDFAPVGSMSLDFQVASLFYKSSSFATSRGNEKIGGTGYCVTYDTDSQSRNVLASPLGEEGHEVAKGCTRVRMIMILDVDVTAERRHYNTYRPLKGKRLTTFCASLALLHPLLSLTHWIFRSLMLPYKSSSHSANHVRCASLRSGGNEFVIPLCGMKKQTTGPMARWKCTPSACGISPGGGDLLCAYFSADLNSSTHSGE